MRKIALCLLVGLCITTSVVGYSQELSEDLAEGIVRLHVIAESNSEEDQRVKLLVRDRLLDEMDKFETSEDIRNSLKYFEAIANSVLKEEGFDYTARAEYGRYDFPTKYYDGFALPRGEYEALRIRLGKAEGENWWCVLFPPLCMVDAATVEQKELLKETFGENYEVVTRENMVVKIKFKLAELF